MIIAISRCISAMFVIFVLLLGPVVILMTSAVHMDIRLTSITDDVHNPNGVVFVCLFVSLTFQIEFRVFGLTTLICNFEVVGLERLEAVAATRPVGIRRST
jgi:hypothetical protein